MMNDTTDRELSLEDEDRLPWLEAVDSDDEEGVSSGKLLGLIGAALLSLAVIVGGVYWINKQKRGGESSDMIAAQEGEYKVKPDEVGGMKVEGQGDAAFAASEGAEANGKVAANQQAEAPVAVTQAAAAAAKPAATGPSATAPVATAGKIAAKPVVAPVATPAVAPAAAAAPSGGLVQIGAYGTEAEANQAWAAVARRIPAVSGMNKIIVPAVVNGKNWFRLRVAAGGDCSKFKSGGASCMVVK